MLGFQVYLLHMLLLLLFCVTLGELPPWLKIELFVRREAHVQSLEAVDHLGLLVYHSIPHLLYAMVSASLHHQRGLMVQH